MKEGKGEKRLPLPLKERNSLLRFLTVVLTFNVNRKPLLMEKMGVFRILEGFLLASYGFEVILNSDNLTYQGQIAHLNFFFIKKE